jgi:hypothetical protein
MTPSTAGTGDENLRLLADDAERNFKRSGASAMRDPGVVDSSANNTGTGLVMPVSDPLRGF